MAVRTDASETHSLPRLVGEAQPLLEAIATLAAAPLATIAQRLQEAILPYKGSTALVIFTEDCTGRPQKKAGDESIISRVSIAELDHIRASLSDGGSSDGGGTGTGSRRGVAAFGGEEHRVLALSSPSNALLVLADPEPLPDPADHAAAEHVLHYLWTLAAERIREKVADAPPSYLIESRAASAERVRVTAELVDHHSTTLETLLAALRSPALGDDAARKSATGLAAKALVGLLVNVRDDGPGELSAAAPPMVRLAQRVEALDGSLSVDVMPGWGADVTVALPLDPPARRLADVSDWNLGERELEVLQLLAAGQRNRAIAAKLHISENTVKFHLRNIYRKVGATSRTEAIAMAMAHSNGLR